MDDTEIAAFDLRGRTAFVTGASSGLGARFATVLARAGARVAIGARRVDRLTELADQIQAFDGRALPVTLDVRRVEDVRRAVAEAETELGPIGILVNSAGISTPELATQIEEADYDAVTDTNAKGAFFMAQEVGRRMIEHKIEGRIINISSMVSSTPVPALLSYAMSKAALDQMTRALSLEWARYGINVNAICPGYIETEMNRDFFRSPEGERLIARMPRRRIGAPSDLDGLLLLLASPAARFLTGAVIPADDGQALSAFS